MSDYSELAKRVDGQYQSFEKNRMPACTLDKQVLNFACPVQVLVQFLYTVDIFAWALAHWASEIEQVRAWQEILLVWDNQMASPAVSGVLSSGGHQAN